MGSEEILKEKKKTKDAPKYTWYNNIGYMTKMLWQADKPMVFLYMAKTIIENLFYVFFFVYLTKYIYQCIVNKTSFRNVVLLITVACVAHVIVHILSAWLAYYQKIRTPDIYRNIFSKVIDTAEVMEYKKFEEPEFYDKFTRAINESVNRAMEALDKLSWFVASAIAAIVAIKMVVDVDALLLLFIVPSIAASFYFGAKAGELYYQLDFSNTRDGRVGTYVKRIFYEKKYAGELRLYNIKDVLLLRHKKAYENMYDRTSKIRNKAAVYESLRWSVFVIASIALPMLYVGWVVKNRKGVDVGAYVAVVTALEFISGNLSDCVEHMVNLSKIGMFVNNLHEFLDYKPCSESGKQKAEKPLDDIDINNVSFQYEGASKPTLHNVDIHIKKGERVAFVGYNGAGKTTLVKLLMGLYKVTDGSIVISGENIDNLEAKSYHNHFGTVFQDLQVFALPISQNVLMREPESEEERQLVINSLEKAQFGEKLKTLPNGIDTMVSKEFDENGLVLSGGETQKIAIARVFAKNPDIVILDEPSSALDPIAEYNMYKNMMEMSSDKTVIFISHRLSSARVADRIYLMNEGTVAETGTHDELMNKNGIYADMFRLQAQNYQESVPDDMEVR